MDFPLLLHLTNICQLHFLSPSLQVRVGTNLEFVVGNLTYTEVVYSSVSPQTIIPAYVVRAAQDGVHDTPALLFLPTQWWHYSDLQGKV